MQSYKRDVREGVSRIVFMLVPFALFLITFAPELIAILGAGRFDDADAALSMQYLQLLAINLPFYGVYTYLQKVCSSLRSLSLFVGISVVVGIAQVLCCFLVTPIFGMPAVALNSLPFFILCDGVTFLSLRHRFHHIGMKTICRSTFHAFVLGLLGSLLGWGILSLLTMNYRPVSTSVLHAFVCCIVAGIPALVLTFSIAVVAKLPEAAFVVMLVERIARCLRRTS